MKQKTKRRKNNLKKKQKLRKTRKYLRGGKPLEILLRMASNCSPETAKKIKTLFGNLLKNNYDVEKARQVINEKNPNGMNALRIAYENNCDTNFRVLLALGAKDLPDNVGQTIVNRALQQNKLNYIEQILNKNASAITETEINTARRKFPPTGDANIDSIQGNNIVEKLSKKAFEQGNIQTILPLEQRADQFVPDATIPETDTYIYEPTEEFNIADEDNDDYLGEQGEGAYNLNGNTFRFPLQVPRAEQFRTNPLQLHRKPDPSQPWSRGGPLPGESFVRDSASRLRGTNRELFQDTPEVEAHPITDLNIREMDWSPLFKTQKNNHHGSESVPIQHASKFGGKTKRKRNKKKK
jgi:hypothetical protein